MVTEKFRQFFICELKRFENDGNQFQLCTYNLQTILFINMFVSYRCIETYRLQIFNFDEKYLLIVVTIYLFVGPTIGYWSNTQADANEVIGVNCHSFFIRMLYNFYFYFIKYLLFLVTRDQYNNLIINSYFFLVKLFY